MINNFQINPNIVSALLVSTSIVLSTISLGITYNTKNKVQQPIIENRVLNGKYCVFYNSDNNNPTAVIVQEGAKIFPLTKDTLNTKIGGTKFKGFQLTNKWETLEEAVSYFHHSAYTGLESKTKILFYQDENFIELKNMDIEQTKTNKKTLK